MPVIIIVINGTKIQEAIGPFDSDKEAAVYLKNGNGPRDASKIIIPLNPLGLYIHPKFPRLTPMEENKEATV